MDKAQLFEEFAQSELVDKILAYRILEAVEANNAEIQRLESKSKLESHEAEDLDECYSWAEKLSDLYAYFGGSE